MDTNDIIAHLDSKKYWWDYSPGHSLGRPKLMINCSSPEEKPDDTDPLNGTVGLVGVNRDGDKIQLYWTYQAAGYHEYWEFDTINEFDTFFTKFITEGIEGVY